ncbi:MAG TPA: TIGR02466 family protein [Steroidobacteraceae bacterium]|nr:TIGR02466 family protein [Steroidobacteraceae bacterium]
MPLIECFATRIYSARLMRAAAQSFNRALRDECLQLERDDAAGRRWSARNYPGGYTSYASVHRLQKLSPTFAALEHKLERHVRAFVAAAQWDLAGRPLSMTDCWVNIMRSGAAHAAHLHPLSSLSGTYYVAIPAGAPGIKFEDPRLERFMAAPPLKAGAAARNRPWLTLGARPGSLVLFESWLRHEVPRLRDGRGAERVSVSFNYSWF